MKLVCGDDNIVQDVNTDVVYTEHIIIINRDVSFIRCSFPKGITIRDSSVRLHKCKIIR